MDVGTLISGSCAFSKSSLNIRKFRIHVLLKPGLSSQSVYFLFPPFPPYCISKGSSTVFKRIDEREHPCLVLELSEKALNFSPLSITLTVGFCRWALSS